MPAGNGITNFGIVLQILKEGAEIVFNTGNFLLQGLDTPLKSLGQVNFITHSRLPSKDLPYLP
jgi:hypothetical protein